MNNRSKSSCPPNNTIIFPETLDRFWIEKSNLLNQKPDKTLIIDLAKTTRIDSAGYCFIRLLHTMYEENGNKLIIRNLEPEFEQILNSWSTSDNEPVTSQKNENFFVRCGDTLLTLRGNVLNALSVLTEMLYWGTLGLFKKRDFKRGALGEQMYLLGNKAFGIVGLLSFLIGIILALQTAIQLQNFGAGIFLAPLLGITMVRELGPLLTAIILAGRTGSATTAEIATMVVGEELDALQTMGINPVQYVVVPKFWAISLTMPMLSIMATAAGILGGFFVAIFYLDLSTSLFWNELIKSIHFRDFWAGFVKSLIFSWLIIWIGSYYGFRVRGVAEAVGKETTASVVTGIFIIILAYALFSFVL